MPSRTSTAAVGTRSSAPWDRAAVRKATAAEGRRSLALLRVLMLRGCLPASFTAGLADCCCLVRRADRADSHLTWWPQSRPQGPVLAERHRRQRDGRSDRVLTAIADRSAPAASSAALPPRELRVKRKGGATPFSARRLAAGWRRVAPPLPEPPRDRPRPRPRSSRRRAPSLDHVTTVSMPQESPCP